MEIFKNRYYSFVFEQEKSLLIYTAFPETEVMSDEELREGFMHTSQTPEEYKPNFFLSDTREQFAVISPDTQAWIAENIYPRWQATGLKKLAVVIPQELIANLSIQQSVDEIEAVRQEEGYEIRYFDNSETAKEWLQ